MDKVTRQMRRAAERRVVRLSLTKADRRRLFRKRNPERKAWFNSILTQTMNEIRVNQQNGQQ